MYVLPFIVFYIWSPQLYQSLSLIGRYYLTEQDDALPSNLPTLSSCNELTFHQSSSVNLVPWIIPSTFYQNSDEISKLLQGNNFVRLVSVNIIKVAKNVHLHHNVINIFRNFCLSAFALSDPADMSEDCVVIDGQTSRSQPRSVHTNTSTWMAGKI